MCIVCHYKNDNKLVLRSTRVTEHKDNVWQCLRYMPHHKQRWICIDCGDTGPSKELNHVCDPLQSLRIKAKWRLVPCPKCGAKIGELCWDKGFDQLGPRTRRRKYNPCRPRMRV